MTADSVWTIGHSTRTLDALLALLAEHGIEAIADIRRFPGSRRSPQYSAEALESTLAAHSIAYYWLPELGGRRRPIADTPNTVWRSDSFRGYADHMATEDFAQGLMALTLVAGGLRTAMMCSEAVWWRCHRALVADALTVLGFRVCHILGPGKGLEHPMTSPAHVVQGQLTYGPARALRAGGAMGAGSHDPTYSPACDATARSSGRPAR